MATIQEIRAKATASTFLQVRFNIHLEREENLWKFEEDLNVLRISKGDYLIAVQVGGKHIDIRNKEADEVNKLITDALKERNIVFRVVKKDRHDTQKILQIKKVRLVILFYFIL